MRPLRHQQWRAYLEKWCRVALVSLVVPVVVATGQGASSASPRTTAGASTAGAPGSASQLASQRAEASALEHRISVDGVAAQIAAERYDEATVSLDVADHRLAGTTSALRHERSLIVVALKRVRSAAVAAYVYGDSAAAQFGELLNTSIADAGTIDTYSGIAATALGRAVAALDVVRSHLDADTRAETAAIAKERIALASASSARKAAVSASAAASATLEQVRGHIAALIAAEEAAAAAAAAARARAAAEEAARARAQALAEQRAAALVAARETALAQARARAVARAARAAAARQAASEAKAASQAEAQANADASVAATVSAAAPSASTTASASAAASSASSVATLGEPALAVSGTNPAGNEAVAAAESYLGVPYVWGGASRAGLDCSGLTMLAWAAAGVQLLHSAWYQYLASQHIPLSELEPGDLIFYDFPNDGTNDPVSHVAMFVGSGPYGAQTIIQAPEPGQDVSYAAMYYVGLVGAGRP